MAAACAGICIRLPVCSSAMRKSYNVSLPVFQIPGGWGSELSVLTKSSYVLGHSPPAIEVPSIAAKQLSNSPKPRPWPPPGLEHHLKCPATPASPPLHNIECTPPRQRQRAAAECRKPHTTAHRGIWAPVPTYFVQLLKILNSSSSS